MSEAIALVDAVAALAADAVLDADAGDLRQFVSFRLNDEPFALARSEVRESVRPPHRRNVPMSPPALAGVANLRGAALPVISLRRAFSMEDAPPDEASCLVVLNSAAPVGLLIDEMAPAITVDVRAIHPPMSVGSFVGSDLVSGLIRAESGLVMILSPKAMLAREFSGGAVEAASHAIPEFCAASYGDRDASVPATEDVHLVSFTVGDQEYAVPANCVEEIVGVGGNVSKIPNGSPVLSGVMTVRGRIVPLVCARTLLGLPTMPEGGCQRVLVLQRNGQKVGILVDRVAKVCCIQSNLIEQLQKTAQENYKLI